MSYQLLARAAALLALLLALAPPAWAGGDYDRQFQRPARRHVSRLLPAPRRTPEIDPGVARSAVTILVGGLLIMHDRRRRSS